MGYSPMSVDADSYVVLDVETNGLKSKEDDLLSISIYRPDDDDLYNRFLPLELGKRVLTTHINGITKSMLKGKKPISQDEVDDLFRRFELDRRVILHYGSLDELFIRNYFARHNLSGFERMRFYNFKKLICSSRFSFGTLTKDNLCKMFGIKGVTETHTGENDCLLEWKLFEAIAGRRLLVTRSEGKDKVFALDPSYIVPVSYLANYPNLSKLYPRPYICCEAEKVYGLKISGEGLRKFPTNMSGMTIEHLINSMIGADKVDSLGFLIENKRKLEYVGEIEPFEKTVSMVFNDDGTVTATKEEDKGLEAELNEITSRIRGLIEPLIAFVKQNLFKGAPVRSQELSVDEELGILALCDLSTDEAILEIKTYSADPEKIAEQLYYEARGRKVYLLTMDWKYADHYTLDSIELTINKVDVFPGIKPNKCREKGIASCRQALESKGIDVLSYENSVSPIRVKCLACGNEWDESYARIKGGRCLCEQCNPKPSKKKAAKPRMSDIEALAERRRIYEERVLEISGGDVVIDPLSYFSARERVKATCVKCGYTWSTRADHLIARCRCKRCSRQKS